MKYARLMMLVSALFVFLSDSYGVCADEKASKLEQEHWVTLKQSLEAVLGSVNEKLDTLKLSIHVEADGKFVGSGTLAFSKSEFACLSLFSRTSACNYAASPDGAVCHIRNGENAVSFDSKHSSKVPVPSFGVSKEGEGQFRLDLLMRVADPADASMINLFVHPETSKHIVSKLAAHYPYGLVSSDSISLYKVPDGDPCIIFLMKNGKISYARLELVNSDDIKYTVAFSDILVNDFVEKPYCTWLSSVTRTAGSSLDCVTSFISGFYMLLGEFLNPSE